MLSARTSRAPVGRDRALRAAAVRRVTVVRASVGQTPNRVVPIPDGPALQSQQAATAVETAFRDGVRLQRLELLLPLIGATDLDDWPGGIRQQFKAAQPMVESILRSVKQVQGLQGPLSANIWDQGDAVGAWTGKNLACVLFPTASTLDRLNKLCSGPDAPALVLIVNPQWETQGNLMSDFGFGQRRENAEKFIASFQSTYHLKQLRVYGDTVRTLKAYPNQWQVHVAGPSGSSDCIALREEMPGYADIETLLRKRPESMMNKSIFDRIKMEFNFNQESMKQMP